MYTYERIDAEMKYNRDMYNDAYSKDDFVFFWGNQPHKSGRITASCLSQWWMCEFTDGKIKFNCAEQYMMYHKALTFGDAEYAEKILQSSDQKQIKDYGRLIRNFDEKKWNMVKREIVINGNKLKFSQNSELKEYLISTGNRILVEASPYDKIWGIGMRSDEDGVTEPAKWKGQNLLGFALMEVRDNLK